MVVLQVLLLMEQQGLFLLAAAVRVRVPAILVLAVGAK
jgi:hypothetical protein